MKTIFKDHVLRLQNFAIASIFSIVAYDEFLKAVLRCSQFQNSHQLNFQVFTVPNPLQSHGIVAKPV